jgi:MFS family permease
MNAGIQAIFLGSVSSLTKDLTKMGTRVGMVLSVVSLACFTGGPIAGALIDRLGGKFVGVCIFGGTSMSIGSVILVGARVAETGWLWRRKV